MREKRARHTWRQQQQLEGDLEQLPVLVESEAENWQIRRVRPGREEAPRSVIDPCDHTVQHAAVCALGGKVRLTQHEQQRELRVRHKQRGV